ncbi:MAG: DUF126 domain-containing protein [Deltaproteobacteria bacterium]|nr:DUF126 domain-containing protein [Deltaproteobacteria bacterium]MBW1929839.1 DUF126 domain-containing protein [Deltaproteobacteria bacterium]MBW2024116.1 DUF126 domain-containing protein [Deltaproteobacteria bacterium]MBW2124375.1 DUF126 domain-containing protein [Deltaproteobacteria bacterium]RLC63478.1 MAG: hypothetical protein DRI01_05135 [Chloroflexota bacterium]
MGRKLKARCVVRGVARGIVLASPHPISFWGGVDPKTGRVIDPHHDLFGQSVSSRVLAFPFGKGSSTGSLIMLELVRANKAPAAIVNVRTEPILATGPVVSKHFYEKEIPIVTLDEESFTLLETGKPATVNATEGYIILED